MTSLAFPKPESYKDLGWVIGIISFSEKWSIGGREGFDNKKTIVNEKRMIRNDLIIKIFFKIKL